MTRGAAGCWDVAGEVGALAVKYEDQGLQAVTVTRAGQPSHPAQRLSARP